MTRIFAIGLFFFTALTSAVLADKRPVVVELFTSQGCSSCPPADRLLRELSEEDGIIALALHVDYWDYIGWEDKFALPQFTKRQKYYAHAMGEKMIYTPQIVVNGHSHVVGSDGQVVRALIEQYSNDEQSIELSVKRQGAAAIITAIGLLDDLPPLDVYLVQYIDEKPVTISRGENLGKTITYSNIVQSWINAGRWSGEGKLHLEAPVTEDMPLVVLLQQAGFGPILAAQMLE